MAGATGPAGEDAEALVNEQHLESPLGNGFESRSNRPLVE